MTNLFNLKHVKGPFRTLPSSYHESIYKHFLMPTPALFINSGLSLKLLVVWLQLSYDYIRVNLCLELAFSFWFSVSINSFLRQNQIRNSFEAYSEPYQKFKMEILAIIVFKDFAKATLFKPFHCIFSCSNV